MLDARGHRPMPVEFVLHELYNGSLSDGWTCHSRTCRGLSLFAPDGQAIDSGRDGLGTAHRPPRSCPSHASADSIDEERLLLLGSPRQSSCPCALTHANAIQAVEVGQAP